MTNKKLDTKLEKIAQEKLGIKTLEEQKSDDLDFFTNEEADFSVWALKDALQTAYELGRKEAKKEQEKPTKIKLAWELGIVEVGKKVTIYNKEYTLVGIDGEYSVFACLNPQTLDDARVLTLTENEINEFIENGDMKGF